MAQSGFFKGEKKKKAKKDSKNISVVSNAPTFTMPEIISKKKKYEQ